MTGNPMETAPKPGRVLPRDGHTSTTGPGVEAGSGHNISRCAAVPTLIADTPALPMATPVVAAEKQAAFSPDHADTLPAILTRASARLMSAQNSAEVLEAKKLAEAALHLAKLTEAANETHADCLRLIARAEGMMADEIDKAQAAGTIGKRGRASKNKVRAPDIYKNLGIPKQRVPEWRDVRNAGPEKIESVIQSVLAKGRAPTKNDILKGIRGKLARSPAEFGNKTRRAPPDLELERRQVRLPADKRYGVIYADPPWHFETHSRDGDDDRANEDRPTMTIKEICALPVPAAEDAVLCLWTTPPMLHEALKVMERWGFDYCSHIVWSKNRSIDNDWTIDTHELLLIGKRGEVAGGDACHERSSGSSSVQGRR